MNLRPHEIGGGKVQRRFTMGGQIVPVGTELTGAQLRTIPLQNLQSLIENRFIAVWPATVGGIDPTYLQRHVVHVGRGLYDVFEGKRLTSEPMSKEDAELLAAKASGAA